MHATVVRAQQPTSAHAGDQAILLSDGTIEGFVGGQCAQNSVRKAALGALQAGESVLLRVLPDGDVHFPGGAGRMRRRQSVPVRRRAGDLPRPAGARAAGPHLRRHPDRRSAGRAWSPRSVTRCTATVTADLAQATAVVIATHGGPEAEMIRAALDAGVGYVGLVASKVRGDAILDELELTDAERRRVHTPVGLPIGAKTPAEIAVSILAEVVRAIRVDDLIAPGRDAATPHVSREEACHGHG